MPSWILIVLAHLNKSAGRLVRFWLLSVINTSCHAYFRISVNMWRYLEGVKPPQKRKTPEEKATYFIMIAITTALLSFSAVCIYVFTNMNN
jgi:hypothetical protein